MAKYIKRKNRMTWSQRFYMKHGIKFDELLCVASLMILVGGMILLWGYDKANM